MTRTPVSLVSDKTWATVIVRRIIQACVLMIQVSVHFILRVLSFNFRMWIGPDTVYSQTSGRGLYLWLQSRATTNLSSWFCQWVSKKFEQKINVFLVMIDVCSCSLDVWKGITSYVKAIVKKLHREIGVEEGKVHIGITQVCLLNKDDFILLLFSVFVGNWHHCWLQWFILVNWLPFVTKKNRQFENG